MDGATIFSIAAGVLVGIVYCTLVKRRLSGIDLLVWCFCCSGAVVMIAPAAVRFENQVNREMVR